MFTTEEVGLTLFYSRCGDERLYFVDMARTREVLDSMLNPGTRIGDKGLLC